MKSTTHLCRHPFLCPRCTRASKRSFRVKSSFTLKKSGWRRGSVSNLSSSGRGQTNNQRARTAECRHGHHSGMSGMPCPALRVHSSTHRGAGCLPRPGPAPGRCCRTAGLLRERNTRVTRAGRAEPSRAKPGRVPPLTCPQEPQHRHGHGGDGAGEAGGAGGAGGGKGREGQQRFPLPAGRSAPSALPGPLLAALPALRVPSPGNAPCPRPVRPSHVRSEPGGSPALPGADPVPRVRVSAAPGAAPGAALPALAVLSPRRQPPLHPRFRTANQSYGSRAPTVHELPVRVKVKKLGKI